ncbi:MAG: molybdopterin-dependent oxidoreductase, partial [Eubacteriales bacterium]|nr:molybdopterin-dependent oxidoreductase [Eubacteriales bacterium]
MKQRKTQLTSESTHSGDEEFSVIGKDVPRVDARAKVTGAAVYAGDIYRRDMLHAKLLHSPHAHANIISINVEKARALPGVAAVLTYKDVPQIYYTSCGRPHPSDTPEDTLILSQRLRYCGDVVAAVAAESKEIARAALDLIEVEYEVLPAYFTPEQSLTDDAIEIHSGSGNICGQSGYEIGDVDTAMDQADFIVEDEFRSPIVTHCQIETHTSLTELDSNGRLIIYAPTQVSSILRERTALALGKKIRDVKVIRTTVGGGFGGKQEPVFEILNAALTIATSRPVRLELTREENLSCTRTRHSSYFKLRTGLKKDGSILARELYARNNGGAYSSHGHNVLESVSSQFALLYPTENLRFEGLTAYTNILIAGAMRAYGIPQYCAAMESHVDHLAATIGMDPLDYRRQVMFKKDSPINISNWSINTFGLPEVIDKCEEEIGYRDFRKQEKTAGSIRRGIGVALSSYGQSCFPWSVEMSGARVMVNEDGSASLFVGSSEIGQGSDTAMQMIAAETLGIPHDSVNVISGDTDVCPFDVGAFASRQTYVTGHAVKKA